MGAELLQMLKASAGNKPIEIFYKLAQGDKLDAGRTPEAWDLIILILSTPADTWGWNNDWYRIQSEQQTIDRYTARSKCLHYIQNTLVRQVDHDALLAGFRVARNIRALGEWNEYRGLGDLAAAIDAQIDRIAHELDSTLQAEASRQKTIEQAVQTKIGARWIENTDRLTIDTWGVD